MAVVSALVGARFRTAGPRHWALVAALGITMVIAPLGAGFSAMTASDALSRALAELPAGDRSVTVAASTFAVAGELEQDDAAVPRQLDGVVAGAPVRELEYRALADSSGRTFALGAVDGLPGVVQLTQGRLPAACTPSRCEVVVVEQGGRPIPKPQASIGLVVVGRVRLTSPLVLSGPMAPPAGAGMLLAAGVQATDRLSSLSELQRAYAWVAPLAADVIRRQGVDHWIGRATAAGDRLALIDSTLTLTTPSAQVQAAADRAQASVARFRLLAGGAAVLLLGAAVAGAAALRPGHVRFVEALRRRGLSAGRLQWVTMGETFGIAATGTILGLLAGAGTVAALATGRGLPTGATVLDAVGTGLIADAVLLGAAWLLMLLVLWPAADRPAANDERRAWQLLTYAAVGATAAVLLVVSRGASSGSGDSLTALLPALVLLAASLVSARLWPGAVRLAGRALPRRAVGARLGLAGVAGHPLLAAATVALVVSGVGAGGFAFSYRATLQRGADDQAAFAVPADLRIAAGTQAGGTATPPLSVAPAADFATAAGSASRAWPVLRTAGSVHIGPDESDVVQFVGLDPAALSDVHRWSSVVGGSSPSAVAAAIGTPATAPGDALPAADGNAVAAGSRITVQVGALPRDVVTLWVTASDGRERALTLSPTTATTSNASNASIASNTRRRSADPVADRSATGKQLSVAVPAGSWRLTGLAVSQSSTDATRRGHDVGEGAVEVAVPSGRIRFAAVSVNGTAVPHPWSAWTGAPGQRFDVAGGGASATLDYRLVGALAVVQATPAGGLTGTASAPLPVAADPRTAALGSTLTLTLNQQPVLARVVATLPRFPTVTGRFVVADRTALSRLTDQVDPGSGQPQELWISLAAGRSGAGPSSADQTAADAASSDAASSDSSTRAAAAAVSRLSSGALAGLSVTSRSAVRDALRSDPVAVGAGRLLLAAAGLAVLVAMAAMVLLVAGERTQDAGPLFSWEADGVPPRSLRMSLWVRSLAVAGLGVPVGVLAGLSLTRLAARLVPLSATATAPQPPLTAATGGPAALAVILAAVAAALLAGAAVSASSFREPMPVRPEPGR